jgi:hypothetical protein
VLRFRSLSVFAVLLLLFACSHDDDDNKEDDNQWREDVIQCEEAVARLVKCCPGFKGEVVLCNYYYHFSGGCGSSETNLTEPALDKGESRCVISTTCEDMVSKGICDRAQDATTYTQHIVTGDGGSVSTNDKKTHPPVCK